MKSTSLVPDSQSPGRPGIFREYHAGRPRCHPVTSDARFPSSTGEQHEVELSLQSTIQILPAPRRSLSPEVLLAPHKVVPRQPRGYSGSLDDSLEEVSVLPNISAPTSFHDNLEGIGTDGGECFLFDMFLVVEVPV